MRTRINCTSGHVSLNILLVLKQLPLMMYSMRICENSEMQSKCVW